MRFRPAQSRSAFALLCLLPLAATGCGGSPVQEDEDLDALRACNRAVKSRVPGQELRSTVRDDGADKWVVNVWADEPAEGTPDYTCEVVRDVDAAQGFRVASIRP
jgi:hypothetical protein